MSDLNKKLQKYINRSQVSVYQLAKNTDLDRTMIQKMIKGTKYPGPKFFYKFCDALMLNPDERDELITLFRIEKIGSSRYDVRRSIRELLDSFEKMQDAFAGVGSDLELPKLELDAGRSGSEEIVGSNNLILYAFAMLQEQIRGRKQVRVDLDLSTMSEILLKALYQLRQEFGMPLEIQQHVLISYQSNSDESLSENIQTLQQVLPPLFMLGEDYQVSFSYVNNIAEDRRFVPFVHYLLTEDHLLLYNAEGNRGLLVRDASFLSAYRSEIAKIKAKSRPLYQFYQEAAPLSAYLNRMELRNRPVASYEQVPCMRLFLAKAAGELGSETDVLTDFRRICSQYKAPEKSEKIRICGQAGLKQFVKDGTFRTLPEGVVLPEDQNQQIPFSTLDERIELGKYWVDFQERCGSYFLKDTDEVSGGGLMIDLYAPNRVVIVRLYYAQPIRAAVIEENSIYDCFLDYFQSLIEYEDVYAPGPGAERLREELRIIGNQFQKHCGNVTNN